MVDGGPRVPLGPLGPLGPPGGSPRGAQGPLGPLGPLGGLSRAPLGPLGPLGPGPGPGPGPVQGQINHGPMVDGGAAWLISTMNPPSTMLKMRPVIGWLWEGQDLLHIMTGPKSQNL